MADLGLQLAVTTQPPSSVAAGVAFGLRAELTYSTGVPDANFNGLVSVILANNPGASTLGGATTVAAVDGVANFAGLTLNHAGDGYTLRVSGHGSASVTMPFSVTGTPSPTPTSPTPTSTTPTLTSSAPTIVAQRIGAVVLKHNKKGKPVGKPVEEIVLTFSSRMNPVTVDVAGNFQVSWASTRKVKRKVVTTMHGVAVVSATMDPSDTVLTLLTSAQKQKFAKGGQVSIVSPGSILHAAAPPTAWAARRTSRSHPGLAASPPARQGAATVYFFMQRSGATLHVLRGPALVFESGAIRSSSGGSGSTGSQGRREARDPRSLPRAIHQR